MSRPKTKEEFRQQIAEAFANVLEEKGLQWKKEWTGVGGNMPQNGITKANYRGCNAFWLSLVSMMKGYTDPRWVTMIQIMDLKKRYHPNEQWHLKKGSKATYVEYWYPFDSRENKALTWEQYRQEIASGRIESEFTLSSRYTAVFNACDIEGIPEIQIQDHDDIPQDDLVKKLSEEMGVQILNDGGDLAYYSPTKDVIHLPTPESFESAYAFNATALHELSHSTGHPTRLNRPQSAFFGTEAYAYEELVAEMCSCFMGSELRTELTKEHLDNHKAYVQSWIHAIREKPETLIRAIKDAQAAANYMDYKAGLITEKDYEKTCGSVMEVKQKAREIER
ncbi:MAG: DUF1738 domain-containing protein [Firmicutes bacterium]|nr:DUF1738 domain-containing protein [Bacillota bacterium]